MSTNMHNTPMGSTAIIVSSCDAFSDAWQPFFTLFFKYWPDCPFPVFLVTNEQKCTDSRVTTLPVGPDAGWATNLQKALDAVDYPFVLYLQEDYFLKMRVDSTIIGALVAKAQNFNTSCLRLYPCPGPDAPFVPDDSLGIVSPDADYRVSLQCAIWKTSALQSLLVSGESGWDMEVKGTQRARQSNGLFLSVKRTGTNSTIENAPVDYLCTAIVKGEWTKEAVKLCSREGIVLDLRRRPILKGKPYEQKKSFRRRIVDCFQLLRK